MAVVKTYWLHVKDVMRDSVFALDYETKRELAHAYSRYSKDTDYEVLSIHSTKIETDVIQPKELIEILS